MDMLKATGVFTIAYIITGVGTQLTQYSRLHQIIAFGVVSVGLWLLYQASK